MTFKTIIARPLYFFFKKKIKEWLVQLTHNIRHMIINDGRFWAKHKEIDSPTTHHYLGDYYEKSPNQGKVFKSEPFNEFFFKKKSLKFLRSNQSQTEVKPWYCHN